MRRGRGRLQRRLQAAQLFPMQGGAINPLRRGRKALALDRRLEERIRATYHYQQPGLIPSRSGQCPSQNRPGYQLFHWLKICQVR